MKRDELCSILVSSNSLIEVFSRFIQITKGSQENFSQAKLAKELGFTSAGAVSDIISGRRLLTKNRLDSFTNYYQLNNNEIEFVNLLYKLEREKDLSEISKICADIERNRLILSNSFEEASVRIKNNMFAIELLASFSIFENNPSIEDFISFFGRARILEIERATLLLQQEGYIVREQKRYKSTKFGNIDKTTLPNGIEAISEAIIHTGNIIQQSVLEDVLIINRIIACKKEVLIANISHFRNELIKNSMSKSEKNHDMVAKFVAGCYPII